MAATAKTYYAITGSDCQASKGIYESVEEARAAWRACGGHKKRGMSVWATDCYVNQGRIVYLDAHTLISD